MSAASHDLDVAVVGAGPAGIAAALRLSQAHLRLAVFDEQPRLGGQLLRQPPHGFRVPSWLAGRAYRQHKQRLAQAESASGIEWRLGTSVWGVFPHRSGAGFDIHFIEGDQSRVVSTQRLLVAAGCYEMPIPMPGWTLPGVMTAGAMQTLLKSQGLVAGQRIVLSGSHPLQLILADQLLDAGVHVERVLFSQPWHRVIEALRSPRTLLESAHPLLEVARILLRLKRAGVRVLFSQCIRRINGESGVEGVEISRVVQGVASAETLEILTCDAVALCYGFLPSSELARQAGASASPCPGGGWKADHDGAGRTVKVDLYVAGESGGVKGGDAAAIEGALVASSILADIGTQASGSPGVTDLTRQMEKRRRFAALLEDVSQLGDAFFSSLLEDRTLICRCEDVSWGEIQAARNIHPTADTVSAVKLLTRAGMGLCQGRHCEHSLRRLLCRSRTEAPNSESAYTVRVPIRPVAIELLCNTNQAVAHDAFELERSIGSISSPSNKESHERQL